MEELLDLDVPETDEGEVEASYWLETLEDEAFVEFVARHGFVCGGEV